MLIPRAFVNNFIRRYSVVTEAPKFNLKTITLPSISNRHKIPIPYQLTYIDTAKQSEITAKIALLLHGSPGSYQDYHLQISFLENRGIRVLCPNFPEFKYVHETNGLYRHSAQDRADLVKCFLKEIKVKKIDLLVGHSSAIYPSTILSLSDTSALKIHRTVLINPGTHIVSRATKPVFFKNVLVYLAAHKWTYKILRSLAKDFLQKISPVKIKDIDHPLFAITTVITGFKIAERCLVELRNKKHPILLIYSLNDKLFEPYVYQEMQKLLVPDKELLKEVLWKYNEKGDLITEGTQKDWIKIICLAGGTHYGIWKHPQIINDNIIEQLNKIN